ncbi:MAG: adenylate/guanylate cyclase domain-containing protein [Planctomycetes bacterium]|nr:adenylate/guanylate cyclase domain-containing protein [Planctomycetota bacterium]
MPYARAVATSASQSRIQQLIEERVKPDADKAAIDKRIWDIFGERWAVMFTDLSGFSRRVSQFGIIHFLQTIYESLRILTPCIESHDGIMLKVEADSMMVIFRRPDLALECSIAMQQSLKQYNANIVPEEQILLCVGLGYGDMLRIGDEDVFGPEVNAASKLGEDTAKAWEILVTENFKSALQKRPGSGFQRLDEAPPGAEAAYKLLYQLT